MLKGGKFIANFFLEWRKDTAFLSWNEHCMAWGIRLLWFNEFLNTLKKLGREASAEEPCFFYTHAREEYLIFFVDNIIIFYHKNNASKALQIIQGIKDAYELSDKGDLDWFLGIKITRNLTIRFLNPSIG